MMGRNRLGLERTVSSCYSLFLFRLGLGKASNSFSKMSGGTINYLNRMYDDDDALCRICPVVQQ